MPLLLTFEQVRQLLNISRSTLRRLIAQDRFPTPADLGNGRCLRWTEDQINDWLAARIKRGSRG